MLFYKKLGVADMSRNQNLQKRKSKIPNMSKMETKLESWSRGIENESDSDSFHGAETTTILQIWGFGVVLGVLHNIIDRPIRE